MSAKPLRWVVGRHGSAAAGAKRLRRVAAIVTLVMAGACATPLGYHLVDQHGPNLFARRLDTVERIVVHKSTRRMVLLRAERVVASYRVALGANPVAHKEIEGDSRTPEGDYRITARKDDSEFYRGLYISYPNDRDRQFAAAIRRDPGGEILIHGQPNDLGLLERFRRPRDWTNGCIAVSNRAMTEIWNAVPEGTPITIEP